MVTVFPNPKSRGPEKGTGQPYEPAPNTRLSCVLDISTKFRRERDGNPITFKM